VFCNQLFMLNTLKLTLAICAVLVSGCAASPLIALGSLAVNETTGRGLTDHVVSAANGQDCRVGRALRDQAVCQPNYLTQLPVASTGVTPSSIAEIEDRYR
jgi:hypothetical protein